MTQPSDRPRLRRALSAIGGAGLILGAGAVAAQDTGRLLSFGTRFGLVADDNLALDPDSKGTTLEAVTGLDFELLYSTPLQTFALSGDVGLRALDNPEESNRDDFVATPTLRLAYERTVPDSRIGVTGFVRRSRVAFLDPLEGGLDDPLVLDDLDDRGERGTRLAFGLGTELELRRRAPIGITLSAGLDGQRYSDTTDTSTLTDETRVRAGVGLRFVLTPTRQATLGLDYSSFDDEGRDEGRRDTYALNAGISQRLRTGAVGLDLGATSTEDGERYSIRIERSLTLPLWSIAGELGATQSVDGDLFTTGALSVTRDLPTGSLSADLRRSVQSGSDDEERDITAASLGYSHQVNALTSANFDLSYIASDPTGDGAASESFGSVGVGLQRRLTEDWRLDMALRHRISDEGTEDTATGNTISVNLRRGFEFRF
ncbi:hypothetical protein OCGS_2637 [Oceaniovalibus guishaninsula JLT2003]|uniref:Outer membrane beta-barrel protein n=1 Tax=Oceaniovalibus guishaninsula JLT2003 TaxID=1231392 RepID=K2I342_9RHOB|nr:hypothetical protein [Oceaniovalibus guishaninsula]EKE43300.1 hypothetical protein OCGS_2637 [Oceaniovalibus guishaninsula JLT2003]